MSKPWVEEVLGSEGTETKYREIDIGKPAEDLRSEDAMSYYLFLTQWGEYGEERRSIATSIGYTFV